MTETLLGKLVMVLSRATPEELGSVYQFATRESPPCAECRARNAELKRSRPDMASETRAESRSPYVFRKSGRHWEVVCCGGRGVRLRNTLGARYLDYLLHAPNQPIRAFDLEVEVQPEKGEARSRNSTQPEADPKAKREYQRTLGRLKAEHADAQAMGDVEKVQCLDGEIEALETALKSSGAADTGERARDNVRKAVAVVMKQLREGGPEERAFAEHLRRNLSIGHESLYSQPLGRIWA
jgi:hypothetical protein